MGAAAQKSRDWTVEQVSGILRTMDEASVIAVLENVRKDRAGPSRIERLYLGLEDGLNVSYRFAVILADMLEDIFAYHKGEAIGSEAYRFILGKEDLENISFLSVQAQYAARSVKDQFYGVCDKGTAG